MTAPSLTAEAEGAANPLPVIHIGSLSKIFGEPAADAVTVLEGIDLDIAENQFVSLVGRSGCGKTTLLNIIAGLEAPSTGTVQINGRDVKGPGQGQGVVFQQHALFPWLTAQANVDGRTVRRIG